MINEFIGCHCGMKFHKNFLDKHKNLIKRTIKALCLSIFDTHVIKSKSGFITIKAYDKNKLEKKNER